MSFWFWSPSWMIVKWSFIGFGRLIRSKQFTSVQVTNWQLAVNPLLSSELKSFRTNMKFLFSLPSHDFHPSPAWHSASAPLSGKKCHVGTCGTLIFLQLLMHIITTTVHSLVQMLSSHVEQRPLVLNSAHMFAFYRPECIAASTAFSLIEEGRHSTPTLLNLHGTSW